MLYINSIKPEFYLSWDFIQFWQVLMDILFNSKY